LTKYEVTLFFIAWSGHTLWAFLGLSGEDVVASINLIQIVLHLTENGDLRLWVKKINRAASVGGKVICNEHRYMEGHLQRCWSSIYITWVYTAPDYSKSLVSAPVRNSLLYLFSSILQEKRCWKIHAWRFLCSDEFLGSFCSITILLFRLFILGDSQVLQDELVALNYWLVFYNRFSMMLSNIYLKYYRLTKG